MIDTHCHLDMDAFDADRDEVVARALQAGVDALITIGSDPGSCGPAVALAERFENVYAAVGLHPHEAKDGSDALYDRLAGLVSHPKVVALGEMGLDYHYDHSPREVQRESFARQLALARGAGIPVIVHSREAARDTMDILRASGVSKGVMHCFSGDVAMAREVLDLGLHISLAGTVTFKKAETLREVARMVPDERLLVETDAPFLAPEPFRGKRNEPAYVVETARFIAGLRGITLDDVDRMTSLNARRLFGIGAEDQGRIAYPIRDSLYLNVTNRCTSACVFCVRFQSDYVKGHKLRLEREPSAEELKAAIGDPLRYREIVFCGYGEPLIRLDVVKEVARWVKAQGGRVRINTNGHADLIHGKSISPELDGIVDALSVSLNAQDAETYDRLCRPTAPRAFEAVKSFIREASRYVPDVQATVVNAPGVDVAACRELAESLGARLRVRELDVVG